MAPGLTPAEILARRKNYSTSVIKAQNPPPKTPSKQIKEDPVANSSSKPDSDEDRRAKLHKWMEEKKRRDMEATRQKNREQAQQKQQQQQTALPKRPNMRQPKIKDVGEKELSGVVKRGNPVGPKEATSRLKHSKSDASVGVKKVAFDSKTCSDESANGEQKATNLATPRRYSQATPSRLNSFTPSRRTIATPSRHTHATPSRHTQATPSRHTLATPSRVSTKKFETLSPDSKFGHWLQLKGKTPQQVKHIGCVTPASKSTMKKKKSSVLPTHESSAKEGARLSLKPANSSDSGDENSSDVFAHLLNAIDGGSIAYDEAEKQMRTICDGTEEKYVSLSRYWLTRASLTRLDQIQFKSFAEKTKEVFRLLEAAVLNQAQPKILLADGARELFLKLYDIAEIEKTYEKVLPLDGTFTLEDEEKEKNGTFTKDQVDAAEAPSLTPPASPSNSEESPANNVNSSTTANPSTAITPAPTAARQALSAATPAPVAVISSVFPASPDTAPNAIASTPIAPSYYREETSPPVASGNEASGTQPPLPPPHLSFGINTPPRPIALDAPLSPPLSEDGNDENNNNDNDGSFSPNDNGKNVDGSLVNNSVYEELEDIVIAKEDATSEALPLMPGSPLSVAAELVTTSPHFIGVRHSMPVAEVTDVAAAPLEAENNVSHTHHNASRTQHNNTTATSGCSSMHDVTNVSTWANFDSNESLEVMELSSYVGPSIIPENDETASGGIDLDSFSEIYLTGESSADSSMTGLASTEEITASLNVEQIVGLAEEEESEEEANKENTPPEEVLDVCQDMDYVLMASPILQSDEEIPPILSQRVRQPFASSTVRLLLKEGASAVGIDGGSTDEVEEENDENLPPSNFATEDEEVEATATTMKTPPLSRKSVLKSASTVVVTPVRRSVRKTPRAKATEEKRRLIDDMYDLSPESRKHSILIPNDTILNLSFGQAQEGDDDEQQ